MFRLGFDRIFSYSLWPIQAASILGGVLGLLSVVLAMVLVFQKLIFTDVMLPGWTSLIVVILFLFGVNFIFLGIIGEYLGRIFIEAKGRPKYVIGHVYEKRGSGDA
jgi:dolichol-phosphate mannosyltransferase